MPSEPDITLEERAVLAVLVATKPQSVTELHATLERRFGDDLELDVFRVRVILERLVDLGLVKRFVI